MEQEKEKGFKVTDKRATFQEEHAETPEREKTSIRIQSYERIRTAAASPGNTAMPLIEANFLTLIFFFIHTCPDIPWCDS